jgi:excisionase family DNA binding protein
MEKGTDLIGSAEACKVLDIHPATLGRWVTQGRLTPAHKLPGRNGAYLFTRSDVERLRDELAAEASA